MKFLLVMAALFASATVNATTVDMEDVTWSAEDQALLSRGYAFVGTSGDTSARVDTFVSLENTFGAACTVCALRMTHADGATFSMSAIDLAIGLSAELVAPVVLRGHTASGGVVSAELQVQELQYGGGFSTFFFDDSWSNLTHVDFLERENDSLILWDNVQVTAVPVPAAVWLFTSALGLLTVRRRTR